MIDHEVTHDGRKSSAHVDAKKEHYFHLGRFDFPVHSEMLDVLSVGHTMAL